jgi:hypothetical protein
MTAPVAGLPVTPIEPGTEPLNELWTQPQPLSFAAALVSEFVTQAAQPVTQNAATDLQAPDGPRAGAAGTIAQPVALSAVPQAGPLTDTVSAITVTPVGLENESAVAPSPGRATASAMTVTMPVVHPNADCGNAADALLLSSSKTAGPGAEHRAARKAVGTTPAGPAPLPSAPSAPEPVAAPAMVSGMGSPGQPLAVLNHQDFGAITSADRFAAANRTVPNSRAALVRIWPG